MNAILVLVFFLCSFQLINSMEQKKGASEENSLFQKFMNAKKKVNQKKLLAKFSPQEKVSLLKFCNQDQSKRSHCPLLNSTTTRLEILKEYILHPEDDFNLFDFKEFNDDFKKVYGLLLHDVKHKAETVQLDENNKKLRLLSITEDGSLLIFGQKNSGDRYNERGYKRLCLYDRNTKQMEKKKCKFHAFGLNSENNRMALAYWLKKKGRIKVTQFSLINNELGLQIEKTIEIPDSRRMNLNIFYRQGRMCLFIDTTLCEIDENGEVKQTTFETDQALVSTRGDVVTVKQESNGDTHFEIVDGSGQCVPVDLDDGINFDTSERSCKSVSVNLKRMYTNRNVDITDFCFDETSNTAYYRAQWNVACEYGSRFIVKHSLSDYEKLGVENSMIHFDARQQLLYVVKHGYRFVPGPPVSSTLSVYDSNVKDFIRILREPNEEEGSIWALYSAQSGNLLAAEFKKKRVLFDLKKMNKKRAFVHSLPLQKKALITFLYMMKRKNITLDPEIIHSEVYQDLDSWFKNKLKEIKKIKVSQLNTENDISEQSIGNFFATYEFPILIGTLAVSSIFFMIMCYYLYNLLQEKRAAAFE
jgi:hypothetical protein